VNYYHDPMGIVQTTDVEVVKFHYHVERMKYYEYKCHKHVHHKKHYKKYYKRYCYHKKMYEFYYKKSYHKMYSIGPVSPAEMYPHPPVAPIYPVTPNHPVGPSYPASEGKKRESSACC
jgi:hypothetical protein